MICSFPILLDEALVINHINASEDINFDWGRLLEDLHRSPQIVDSTLFCAFPLLHAKLALHNLLNIHQSPSEHFPLVQTEFPLFCSAIIICFISAYLSICPLSRLNFHEPPPIAHQSGSQFTHVRRTIQIFWDVIRGSLLRCDKVRAPLNTDQTLKSLFESVITLIFRYIHLFPVIELLIHSFSGTCIHLFPSNSLNFWFLLLISNSALC